MKAAGFDFFDLVACRPIGVRGDDVEQVAGNSSIGKMCGDARAHGSGAKNGDFINALHNGPSKMNPL
jgi:hypothetical protein